MEMRSHQSVSRKKLVNGNRGPNVYSDEEANLFPKTVALEQQVARSQKQGGT